MMLLLCLLWLGYYIGMYFAPAKYRQWFMKWYEMYTMVHGEHSQPPDDWGSTISLEEFAPPFPTPFQKDGKKLAAKIIYSQFSGEESCGNVVELGKHWKAKILLGCPWCLSDMYYLPPFVSMFWLEPLLALAPVCPILKKLTMWALKTQKC